MKQALILTAAFCCMLSCFITGCRGRDVTSPQDVPTSQDVPSPQDAASDVPSSDAPSSDAPSSDSPVSDAPSSNAPSSKAPAPDTSPRKPEPELPQKIRDEISRGITHEPSAPLPQEEFRAAWMEKQKQDAVYIGESSSAMTKRGIRSEPMLMKQYEWRYNAEGRREFLISCLSGTKGWYTGRSILICENKTEKPMEELTAEEIEGALAE